MMVWDKIVVENTTPGTNLVPRIDALFAEQRERWVMFREGEAALASIKTKVLTDKNSHVVVQANPGRKKSTHAKTDTTSIASRPCFLCPENMPTEEQGIAFDELVILPNPHPVLGRHCTIPDRTHRPQQLTGHLDTMLELARAVGPDMLVFYNGPNCGASAPDHFHFQACDAGEIPLLGELPLPEENQTGISYFSFGRRMLVFADVSALNLQINLERSITELSRQEGVDREPMFSLLSLFRNEQYISVLTPRAAHRPSCYSADGDQRIAISPATLEMAGILIVTEPKHFDRVNASIARRIYEEVCFDEMQFARFEKAVR